MIDNEGIFNKAISFWPNKLIINDGISLTNGGFRSESLVGIHDEVETKILQIENSKLRHMDWAIYTVIHELAKSNTIIFPLNINKERVYSIYRDNQNK